jgi:hypothetical protein
VEVPSNDQANNAKEPLTIEFVLHWTLQVLGVTAAILFGIWAPLSYKASADGNSQNNAAQSVFLSSVSAASSSLAGQLDDLNSRVASELDTLNTRMAALGQLSLLEFCLSQTVSSPGFQVGSYVYVCAEGVLTNTTNSRRIWQRALRSRSLSPRPA